MIPERLEHLRAFLDAKGVDAVVMNKYVNLHYFSGFRGDDTLLLVSRDRAFLVTDFRYTEQAATQAPLYERPAASISFLSINTKFNGTIPSAAPLGTILYFNFCIMNSPFFQY